MRLPWLLCLWLLCGCDATLADLYGSFSMPAADYCDEASEPRCAIHASEDGQPWTCDILLHRCLPPGACIDGVRSCQSATLPICHEGRCTPCSSDDTLGDAECTARAAQRRDDRTHCMAGACVECRAHDDCPIERPVCRSQACEPCKAHDECGSGICRVDSRYLDSPATGLGTCVDRSLIVYVDADASSSGTGEQYAPMVSTADALQLQRPFLYLLPAANSYPAIDVRDRRVVLLGGGGAGAPPRVDGIRVQAGTLVASQIALTPAVGQDGAVCGLLGELVLQHVALSGPPGPARGIVALDGCALAEVTASRIDHVQGTGIAMLAAGSTYRIVNSAVSYCGSTNSRYGSAAVVLAAGSQGRFTYNTLFQNLDAVDCGGAQRVDNFVAVGGGITGCTTDRNGDLGADLEPNTLQLADTPRNRACCIDLASPDTSVSVDFSGKPRTSGAGPDRGYLER